MDKLYCPHVSECPHESKVLDGKKSYCEKWERWTNCREVGHCVYEKFHKPEQIALLTPDGAEDD